MSEKYPLEAARELRKKSVDDAGEALAAAVRAHAEAAAAVQSARARLEMHDERTAELVRSERDAGLRRADELLVAQAYLARRRKEREEHVEAIRRAEDDERAKENAVLAARDALATAKAEAEAVEKHHGRWQDERRKRAEARADDEVEDLVSAQSSGRHGGSSTHGRE